VVEGGVVDELGNPDGRTGEVVGGVGVAVVVGRVVVVEPAPGIETVNPGVAAEEQLGKSKAITATTEHKNVRRLIIYLPIATPIHAEC